MALDFFFLVVSETVLGLVLLHLPVRHYLVDLLSTLYSVMSGR